MFFFLKNIYVPQIYLLIRRSKQCELDNLDKKQKNF